MSMGLTRHLGIGIAAVLTVWAAPYPARAETKLTDFIGMWSGSGTDSNSPWESSQPTSCQTMVQADLRHMTSDTDCDGQAGLRKKIHLSITLDGNQITGDLSQTTSVRGSDASEMKGTISGRKAEDTASFQVQIPGLGPIGAKVDLKLLSRSSYRMHVAATTFGVPTGTLMHVEFHRTARR